VEAPSPDHAINALSENGIVTESLRPDPKSLNLSPLAPAAPEFAEAIDSALDSSSMQVPFDDLMDRYRGKQVWVIDRDKIRSRVAQVVDQALALSQERAETLAQTRERVAVAIQGMFGDNRNIASEAPASQVALEQQIQRLGKIIRTAEVTLASIGAAAQRISAGYFGAPRREGFRGPVIEDTRQEVLLEIFKDNLELQRSLEEMNGAVLAQQDSDATEGEDEAEAAATPTQRSPGPP
jgi:hypothetical protein